MPCYACDFDTASTAYLTHCSCPPPPSQTAKAYCREVVRILRTLKAKRDMSVNEARLIVSIEDPRTREQRQLGIEVSTATHRTAPSILTDSLHTL